MKHLIYMGNVFHINGSTISITPLQSRIEVIQKIATPQQNVKGCKKLLWGSQLPQHLLQTFVEVAETYK